MFTLVVSDFRATDGWDTRPRRTRLVVDEIGRKAARIKVFGEEGGFLTILTLVVMVPWKVF